MPIRPRPPQVPQIKKWNLFFYVLVFLALTFGGRILALWTDYFWFEEVGLLPLFQKSLATQILLGASAFLAALLFLWGNLWTARRLARRVFVVLEPGAAVSSPLPLPQLADLKPFFETLLLLGIFLAALFLGLRWSGHWEIFLKFRNALPFGESDPLFNRDIGFYVFRLPFLRLLQSFGFVLLLLSLLAAAAAHLLNGRIYFPAGRLRVADDARVHLSLLAGGAALLIAVYFQIKTYDLLYLQRAVSPGAGYADIHAYLPGLKLLRFVALASALLFFATPWAKSGKAAVGAVLLLLGGTLAVKAYAEIVQKFEVAPNEISKETPFIRLAIENTRRAYGIEAAQELEFDPQTNLTPQALRKNDLTVKNTRLWEHRPLLTSYGQLQEIRTYYDFLDADNDRYLIDGEYRQVMLSVRELSPESLPSRIWINEHLTYTHGYGLCMGPVNRISPEGLPEFFIKDIPPASNIGLKVSQPAIYYGEAQASYAIVNTLSKNKEFDYPAGEENVYTTYSGSGGVPFRNYLRKLLFSLRMGEIKILLSGEITPESRILFYRQILERLYKAAPFLRFDADPYLVIAEDGRLFWIADGYTTSDRYPYSERSLGINYIRNSVKATVDAYNGTLRFYLADPSDPIARTYDKIFPGLFAPLEAMPADLRRHLRYPQTLMNVQAQVYATYHMTEPQVFYNKEDLWKIPLRTLGGRSEAMDPYYTVMKLAGVGAKEEFILMVPFTPAKKENMIAWMAARCDPPNYGKLLVYNFPKQKLVYGPQQIESRIDQDAEISKQLTLWDQGGSRVIRGSLLVIPVEQSLLYIQPMYLEASGGGLPELKRIIVAYGNSIAMEENLELSLLRIFGGKFESREKAPGETPAAESNQMKNLLRQARERFDNAQRASRQGDWAGYGQEMKALERLLNELSRVQ